MALRTLRQQIIYDANEARHNRRKWRKEGHKPLENYYEGVIRGLRCVWNQLGYREQYAHLFPDTVMEKSNG